MIFSENKASGLTETRMHSASTDTTISENLTNRSAAIAQTIGTLLEIMGVSAEISIDQSSPHSLDDFTCNIQVSEDSNLLIGQHGLNLEALQTLARLIVRKKVDGWANFSVDVNSYRASRASALLEEVKKLEQQVHQSQSEIAMRPMTASERKCVHTALANSLLVMTESFGSGENRRIVIKPKSSSVEKVG